MLTKQEEDFIEYWELNRMRKKRVFRQLAVGLPLGVFLAIAIFINFFSGWYKRANMILHTQSSLVLVILLAVLLIVIFITVFSFRHKWEMNEQHYKELLFRKDQELKL